VLVVKAKIKKAGLVDPAFLLWNWFVNLVWIGKPECQNPLGRHRVLLLSHFVISHNNSGSKVSTFLFQGFKVPNLGNLFFSVTDVFKMKPL
jgi:hypothetical protein